MKGCRLLAETLQRRGLSLQCGGPAPLWPAAAGHRFSLRQSRLRC